MLLSAFQFFSISAFGQNTNITITLTLTNTVPITNNSGAWLSLQGYKFTWTNRSPAAALTSALQIPSTNTTPKATTNLYTKLRTGFGSRLAINYLSETSLVINPGVSVSLIGSNSAGWASLTFSTNQITSTNITGSLAASNVQAMAYTIWSNGVAHTITGWPSGGGGATNGVQITDGVSTNQSLYNANIVSGNGGGLTNTRGAVINQNERTGLTGGFAYLAGTSDYSNQLGVAFGGLTSPYPQTAYLGYTRQSKTNFSQDFSWDYSSPANFGGSLRMPYNPQGDFWKFHVNGALRNQTNINIADTNFIAETADIVLEIVNWNKAKYSQFSVIGVKGAAGSEQLDFEHWSGIGVGNPNAIEAFAGVTYIVGIKHPFTIAQTYGVDTNGVTGGPGSGDDDRQDHQVTTWDFEGGKIHFAHLVQDVYSFTNPGWKDAMLLDYVKDTLTVRSNINARKLTGSNVVVHPNTEGADGLVVKRAFGDVAFQVGTLPSSSAFGTMWLGPQPTPNDTNYTLLSSGENLTRLNAPNGDGLVEIYAGNLNHLATFSKTNVTINTNLTVEGKFILPRPGTTAASSMMGLAADGRTVVTNAVPAGGAGGGQPASAMLTNLSNGNGNALTNLNLGGLSQGLIFVDATSGNDTTATGAPELPFATLTAAQTAAVSGQTIVAVRGNFNEGPLGKDGVAWYFNDGTSLTNSTTVFSIRSTTTIGGRGTFYTAGSLIIWSLDCTNSSLDVNCKAAFAGTGYLVSQTTGNTSNTVSIKGDSLSGMVNHRTGSGIVTRTYLTTSPGGDVTTAAVNSGDAGDETNKVIYVTPGKDFILSAAQTIGRARFVVNGGRFNKNGFATTGSNMRFVFNNTMLASETSFPGVAQTKGTFTIENP